MPELKFDINVKIAIKIGFSCNYVKKVTFTIEKLLNMSKKELNLRVFNEASIKIRSYFLLD